MTEKRVKESKAGGTLGDYAVSAHLSALFRCMVYGRIITCLPSYRIDDVKRIVFLAFRAEVTYSLVTKLFMRKLLSHWRQTSENILLYFLLTRSG